MNLMCKIFGHKWIRHDEWSPSFDALIVEKVIAHDKCERCKKRKQKTWFNFKKYLDNELKELNK